MRNEPFLQQRFTGKRFEEHELPLDVLKGLSALNDIVLNIAMAKFREHNPARKRLPKGFKKQNSLVISRLREGSTVLDIRVCSREPSLWETLPLWMEDTKKVILNTIQNISKKLSYDECITPSILASFAEIGRPLQDDEAIHFEDKDLSVVYTSQTCKDFHLASQRSYSETVEFYGTICEYDKQKCTGTFLTFSEKRFPFNVTEEFQAIVEQAFYGYPKTHVALQGIQNFTADGKEKNKIRVDSLEILDPLDVSARMEEFRCLQEGWLEGTGKPFDRKQLEWLENLIISLLLQSIRPPYLYPTEGENISMEWDVDKTEISVEFQLEQKTAHFFLFHKENGDVYEKTYNLTDDTEYKAFVNHLKETIL